MLDYLPEVCFIKIFTQLDRKSQDNFMEYLNKFSKDNYNNLKLRINKSLRAVYPVLSLVERTHCFLDKINTKKGFMEVYSYVHTNVSTFNEEIRIKQLDKSVCYGVIVEKLLQKKMLDSKKTKKFIDIIDYRKYTFVKDNFSLCKLDYVNVKIDGVTCKININFLDDYLSLGIAY